MAAFNAMKNPLLLAGREVVFASISIIASSTLVSRGYQHIININSKKRRDFPIPIQIATGMEVIGSALSLAFYAGLSKLSQQPGAKLYPMPSRRPPLPIPQTIAVASMAFVLGPIVSVSFSLVTEPLIKLCHNVAEDIKSREIVPTIQDRTSSDMVAASVEQVPLTRDKMCIQMSRGTKNGPLMEAAVPGYMTVLTPLVEEIFFRGLLFARLIPNLGCIPAALTSSALFGVLHRGTEGTLYIPISEAMIGLACSLLYFRTGRLLVPFALHSGINVFAVVQWAFSSCPVTLADQYHSAMDPEAFPNPPVLSFWERRVAKNFSSIYICMIELASALNGKASSAEDAPFLPLDFWGTAEVASQESIFYNQQHGRLMKAPSLCNSDGTPSNFANLLMDVEIAILFGDKDSISVDRLIEYSHLQKRLQFAFHIVATWPEHAKSGHLQLTMNSSFFDLADLKDKSQLDEGQLQYFWHDFRQEAGYLLLQFPLKEVTRSEYSKACKQNFADGLRLGQYSELNRDLFIIYCLLKCRADSSSSSIPELLNGYCDFAAKVPKQPEWYKEFSEELEQEKQQQQIAVVNNVKKEQERKEEMSNAASHE